MKALAALAVFALSWGGVLHHGYTWHRTPTAGGTPLADRLRQGDVFFPLVEILRSFPQLFLGVALAQSLTNALASPAQLDLAPLWLRWTAGTLQLAVALLTHGIVYRRAFCGPSTLPQPLFAPRLLLRTAVFAPLASAAEILFDDHMLSLRTWNIGQALALGCLLFAPAWEALKTGLCTGLVPVSRVLRTSLRLSHGHFWEFIGLGVAAMCLCSPIFVVADEGDLTRHLLQPLAESLGVLMLGLFGARLWANEPTSNEPTLSDPLQTDLA